MSALQRLLAALVFERDYIAACLLYFIKIVVIYQHICRSILKGGMITEEYDHTAQREGSVSYLIGSPASLSISAYKAEPQQSQSQTSTEGSSEHSHFVRPMRPMVYLNRQSDQSAQRKARTLSTIEERVEALEREC